MKTYLYPRHMRLGQPIITAVTKDEHGFWLVTYHDLAYDHKLGQMIPKDVNGTGRAYNATNSFRISEELYNAFVAEAKENRRRYPQETEQQREQREAELAEMVNQYKLEHGLT